MASFVDRFQRLEIPEAKRRIDWSFLDTTLALPEPLPMAEQPLLVVLGGRALEPTFGPTGEDWIDFYRQPLALVPRGLVADAEAAWRHSHAAELERQGRRFLDGIATAVLRERAGEAIEILTLNAPARGLLDGEKLLRVHGKLFNLLTLHDYARIFEKAIDPGFFRELMALPATCAPADMLARIAASLPLIHKKARSPLRNKMECARAMIGGVTYLPVYREPAANLFTAWLHLLDREVKVTALARHA
jgi:hypothetical protein